MRRKNLPRLIATSILVLAANPSLASHFPTPSINSKLLDNRIEALDPDIGAKILKSLQGMNLPASAPIRLTVNRSGKVAAVEFLDNQIDKGDRDKAKKSLSSITFGVLPFNAHSSGSINLIFTKGDLLQQQQTRPNADQTQADKLEAASSPGSTTGPERTGDTATASAARAETAALDVKDQYSDFSSEIKNLYNDYNFARLDTANFSPPRAIFGSVYEQPLKSDESDKQEQALSQRAEVLRRQGRLDACMICLVNAAGYPLRMHDVQKAQAHIDEAVAVAAAGGEQNRRYLREAMLAYANALLQYSSDNKLQGAELLLKTIGRVPSKDRHNAKFELDVLKAEHKLYQRQGQTPEVIATDKKIAAKCISMKPVAFKDAMEAYRDIEEVAPSLTLTDETRDASQKCLSLIEEEYDINSIYLLPELANLILIAEQNHYLDESAYLQKRITDVVEAYVPPVYIGQGSSRNEDALRGCTAVLSSLTRLQSSEGGNSIHAEALETLHRQLFKLRVKVNGCDINALQTFCSFLQTAGKNDEAAELLTDACHYLEVAKDTNDTQTKFALRTARALLVQSLQLGGRAAEASEVSDLILRERREEAKVQLARDEEELKALEIKSNPDYPRMAEIRIKMATSARTDKDEPGFQKQMPRIIEALEKIRRTPNPTQAESTGITGISGMVMIGSHLDIFSKLQSLMQIMIQNNQALTLEEQDFLVRAFSTLERQVPGSIDTRRMNIFGFWGRSDNSKIEEKILTALLKVRQERDGMHAPTLRPIYEALVRFDQNRNQLAQVVVHDKNILDLDRSNDSDPSLIAHDYLNLAVACVAAGQTNEADKYLETTQNLLKDNHLATPPTQTTTPARLSPMHPTQSAVTRAMADLARSYAEHKQTEKADRLLRVTIGRIAKTSGFSSESAAVDLAVARLVMNYTEASEQMKLIDLLQYAIDASEQTQGKDNFRSIQLRYKLANAYLMASCEPGAESKAADLMHRSESEFDRIVQLLESNDTGLSVAVKNQQLRNYLRDRLAALRTYGHEDAAKALESKVHLEPLPVMPMVGAPIIRFFRN